MRKSDGIGYLFRQRYRDRHGALKQSTIWSTAISVNGIEQRESTGTDNYQLARTILKQRIKGEAPAVAKPKRGALRYSIEDLIADVKADYADNGHRSLRTLERSRFPHLREYWTGREMYALKKKDLHDYRKFRQGQVIARGKSKGKHPAVSTINREVDVIHHGLVLAYGLDKVDRVPSLKKPQENNIRKGYLELEQFELILAKVDPWWHELFRIAYITGWRVDSELCPMTKAQVDLVNKVISLDVGTTKNDEGRYFPFTPALESALKTQLERAKQLEKEKGRIIKWLFPRRRTGLPLTSAYKPFKAGAIAAGLSAQIPHNFRRTAVRTMEFANIDRQTQKAMIGHKSNSVYERYNIVDKRRIDLGRQRLTEYETHLASHREAEKEKAS